MVPTTAGNQLPKAPTVPEQRGVSAQALAARIDAFLASRGYKAVADPSAPGFSSPRQATPAAAVAEFVCEDDVRVALAAGTKLTIGEKTIITPSARDLGESNKVFVQASWPH